MAPAHKHRFLKRLGPYQSLLFLVVPLTIVEPLKLLALFVIGGGHFIAGILIMISAYAGSLFITERLFTILKPKLLIVPWVACAWRLFVTVRDKLIYWLRRRWAPSNLTNPAAGCSTAASYTFAARYLRAQGINGVAAGPAPECDPKVHAGLGTDAAGCPALLRIHGARARMWLRN
jgi:hypothetical protein